MENDKSMQPIELNAFKITNIAEQLFNFLSQSVSTDKQIGFSGIPRLDSACPTLFNAGKLIVFGGRPQSGKTLLLNTMLAHRAAQKQGALIYFTTQCNPARIVMSLLVGPRTDYWFKQGKLTEEDHDFLNSELNKLAQVPLFIVPVYSNPINTISETVTLVAETCGKIDSIWIDSYSELREQLTKVLSVTEQSEMLNAFKRIAKAHSCPFVVTANLSRNIEYRSSFYPKLYDLEGDGELENIADEVLLLYREKLYYPKRTKNDDITIFSKKTESLQSVVFKIDLATLMKDFKTTTTKEYFGRSKTS